MLLPDGSDALRCGTRRWSDSPEIGVALSGSRGRAAWHSAAALADGTGEASHGPCGETALPTARSAGLTGSATAGRPRVLRRGGRAATGDARGARARGRSDAAADRRGHRAVPGVPRGAAAPRRRLPAGPTPGPSTGQLMRPPVACRVPLGSPPRRARRGGGVCPRVSPPALRRLGLPPPAFGPPPVPAGVPVVCAQNALPSALGFGYNPHSF